MYLGVLDYEQLCYKVFGRLGKFTASLFIIMRYIGGKKNECYMTVIDPTCAHSESQITAPLCLQWAHGGGRHRGKPWLMESSLCFLEAASSKTLSHFTSIWAPCQILEIIIFMAEFPPFLFSPSVLQENVLTGVVVVFLFFPQQPCRATSTSWNTSCPLL